MLIQVLRLAVTQAYFSFAIFLFRRSEYGFLHNIDYKSSYLSSDFICEFSKKQLPVKY